MFSDFSFIKAYFVSNATIIRGDAIVPVVRVVVVETAVRVDITRIVRVAGIGSAKPPIPGRRT